MSEFKYVYLHGVACLYWGLIEQAVFLGRLYHTILHLRLKQTTRECQNENEITKSIGLVNNETQEQNFPFF